MVHKRVKIAKTTGMFLLVHYGLRLGIKAYLGKKCAVVLIQVFSLKLRLFMGQNKRYNIL